VSELQALGTITPDDIARLYPCRPVFDQPANGFTFKDLYLLQEDESLRVNTGLPLSALLGSGAAERKALAAPAEEDVAVTTAAPAATTAAVDGDGAGEQTTTPPQTTESETTSTFTSTTSTQSLLGVAGDASFDTLLIRPRKPRAFVWV
jgi:hypothetical protein